MFEPAQAEEERHTNLSLCDGSKKTTLICATDRLTVADFLNASLFKTENVQQARRNDIIINEWVEGLSIEHLIIQLRVNQRDLSLDWLLVFIYKLGRAHLNQIDDLLAKKIQGPNDLKPANTVLSLIEHGDKKELIFLGIDQAPCQHGGTSVYNLPREISYSGDQDTLAKISNLWAVFITLLQVIAGYTAEELPSPNEIDIKAMITGSKWLIIKQLEPLNQNKLISSLESIYQQKNNEALCPIKLEAAIDTFRDTVSSLITNNDLILPKESSHFVEAAPQIIKNIDNVDVNGIQNFNLDNEKNIYTPQPPRFIPKKSSLAKIITPPASNSDLTALSHTFSPGLPTLPNYSSTFFADPSSPHTEEASPDMVSFFVPLLKGQEPLLAWIGLSLLTSAIIVALSPITLPIIAAPLAALGMLMLGTAAALKVHGFFSSSNKQSPKVGTNEVGRTELNINSQHKTLST